jgi:phosphohistidine phosphatase
MVDTEQAMVRHERSTMVVLVHHGEAVGPEVDPRRPLSEAGRAAVARLAVATAARGVTPGVVWHSGKLRAKQTAEEFWRQCNALAEFSATRDLQPDDPPRWILDRLQGESRNVLIAGHFHHLPRLLALMLGTDEASTQFPLHGVVALETRDEGAHWSELWRFDDDSRESPKTRNP